MIITLTKAQYEEMKILAASMATVQLQTANSVGELMIDGTKIEWGEGEVKFTLSD